MCSHMILDIIPAHATDIRLLRTTATPERNPNYSQLEAEVLFTGEMVYPWMSEAVPSRA